LVAEVGADSGKRLSNSWKGIKLEGMGKKDPSRQHDLDP
jgi:hypothetical protein